MKIIDTDFSNHIKKSVTKDLGNVYFFNHLAVIEFNEGVHVDINNTTEIFSEIKSYFGSSTPFGIIANRINSYSVNLLDADLFRKQFENLGAYAVVGHSLASKMNAEIENSFCISKKINFDSVYTAFYNVYSKVMRKSLAFSLN